MLRDWKLAKERVFVFGALVKNTCLVIVNRMCVVIRGMMKVTFAARGITLYCLDHLLATFRLVLEIVPEIGLQVLCTVRDNPSQCSGIVDPISPWKHTVWPRSWVLEGLMS